MDWRQKQMNTFKEFLVESDINQLKKFKVALTPEERGECLTKKAIWHHGKNGAPSPAVWKSVNKGKTTFVTNTHRAYNTATTLKGAIKCYHDFIKGTA